MIGLWHIQHEQDSEVLRSARAMHLGQASDEDYRREMARVEKALNG